MPISPIRADSRCGPRRMRHAIPSAGAYVATLALVTLALVLLLYGARWTLEQLPAAPDELAAATCMLDALNADVRPASACASHVSIDKETL